MVRGGDLACQGDDDAAEEEAEEGSGQVLG
jgi:hypothetical protein